MSTTEQKARAIELAKYLEQFGRNYLDHEIADFLRRLSAENEALRAELATERMRLSACGVVALADTPESAAKARDMSPEFRSASCDDVARRVDECIAMRAQVEALTIENQALWTDRSTLQSQRDAFLEAGLRARYLLVRDRDAADEAHTGTDGEIDADGARAVAEFNAVIAYIDSAVEGGKKVQPTPSPLTRPAVPWREAVLDLIDECPGLSMEQDHWLSRRVKELDFPSVPTVDHGILHLLRRLLSNQHTFTGPEFRAELTKIVGEAIAAAPQPEAQPSDRDAIFKALQETQEALNVSQCPWCGEWGPQYRDSDLPAAYCRHEFTLRPWKAFATGKPEAQPTEAAQPTDNLSDDYKQGWMDGMSEATRLSVPVVTAKDALGLLAIEDDAIVLRLTADAAASSFANDPKAQTERPAVTDKQQFLRDVFNALASEREDGSTRLTDVLDWAEREAWEQGSLGLAAQKGGA